MSGITRSRWVGMLAAVALCAAGRADAFNIVFNGPGGFGISAASASSAAAAGVPIFDVAALAVAKDLGIVIPAPDVQSFHLVQSPSVANPNTAASIWTVNNTSARTLDSAWLVFTNPETYTASQVGFEIDPSAGWALFDVIAAGQDYFYPAVFLGDIGAGDATTFAMHHRVGETLTMNGQGQLVLPKYHVAALEGLPEPTVIALILLVVAVAAVVRRRNA